MKKLFFLAIVSLLLFSSNQLNAQLNLGVKVGYNGASQKLNINNSLGLLGLESESVSGFNVGAFLEIGESNFKFQPEVSFSSKGSLRPDTTVVDGDRTHNLSYIEVPLQAKYYVFDNDKFSAYVSAGVYAGFAIGGNISPATGDDIKLTFDEADGYENIDFGGIGGIGAALALGEGKAFVELRSTYGVKKVQKGDLLDLSGSTLEYNAKNRVSQFNVGYIFSF